jgi:CheY-like chemotaxis protein
MQLQPKLTVLLVDDNPYIMNFLNKSFTKEGFEVIRAFDAKYAIELLIAENSPDINVVITDYEMPHINGLEFANTLKEIEKYKHVPIILYTQHSYMNCEDEKYKVFDLILTKPDMPQEIIKKAKELCDIQK